MSFKSWDELKGFLAKVLPHREFVETVCDRAGYLKGLGMNELVLEAMRSLNRLTVNIAYDRNTDQIVWDAANAAACMMLLTTTTKTDECGVCRNRVDMASEHRTAVSPYRCATCGSRLPADFTVCPACGDPDPVAEVIDEGLVD